MKSTLAAALLISQLLPQAWAVDPVATQIGRTQRGATVASASTQSAWEMEQAKIWGLTVNEVRRAHALMQPGSPRAAFSSPNISPLEVLGIHARTAAERQRYATLFAKALRADTERVIAWTMAYGQVAKRLYPNEKIIDFGNRRLPAGQDLYLR